MKKDESLGRILAVDDDQATRESLGQMLELRGYQVHLFACAEQVLAWPELPQVECIITDVKMPGMDGEELLAALRAKGHTQPVLVVTGHGDVAMAVRCLQAGAYDFVEKPFSDDVLLASVQRAVETSRLRQESRELRRRLALLPSAEVGRFGMIGRSLIMQDLYQQIEVLARTDATVLIKGETGVGKELVARAIHAASGRAERPFVPINAGGLPETLLESELFGHARGAFTGADRSRTGKLVTASEGTLLLDEVDSISLSAQLRLLRVLEDGLVEPLGSDQARRVDLRLLLTTKMDLEEQVEAGRMRRDFYHRIMVLPLVVPSLREHTEDIPLLVSHFLEETVQRTGIPAPLVGEESLAALIHHSWPGNVRELKHAVERMVVTAVDGKAGSFLQDESFHPRRLLSLPPGCGFLHEELGKAEMRIIEESLRRHQGRVSQACAALGISRRALYERMKKYGLYKEDFH